MTRTVTLWGHATVLLEVEGVRLLTDPVLRGRFPALRGLRGHPLLERPPHDFARRAAVLAPETRVVALDPGEPLELDGAPA